VTSGTSSRLIASCFSLSGFAVAIVAGMAVGNPSNRILTVAICSLIVCHIVGLCAGLIGERIVEEYMKEYRAARPVVPGSHPQPVESSGASA
jgi:putative Mn2+ efflux pump MntP